MHSVQERPLLSVEEQIQRLKDKGVRFELTSEAEARRYLQEDNHYFKIIPYQKMFETYRSGKNKGKYVNLDFAFLQDLYKLDRLLRLVMLPITLAIEDSVKVKIMQGIMSHPEEDGYSIVKDYFSTLDQRGIEIKTAELERLEKDYFNGHIARKYKGNYPIWSYLELVSFGTLIDFYRFCSIRWQDSQIHQEYLLLRHVKSLRNACAHNSIILNEIIAKSKTYVQTPSVVNDELDSLGFSKRSRKRKINSDKIQQVIISLYMYSHSKVDIDLKVVIGRIKQEFQTHLYSHLNWYAKEFSVYSFFEFFLSIMDSWL